MKIGTVKSNLQTRELEVHLELGPALGAAVYWVFWHGLFVFLGIAIERAYLLTQF